MRKLLLIIAVIALSIGVVGSVAVPAYAAENPSSDVTVETIPGQSLTEIVAQRTERSWPWYVVRASGIVAGISLVLLLLSGIGSITGYTFRLLDPLTAWATHRALGITFVVSVIIHMVTLLFDHFVPFGIIDVLVPWASDYKSMSLFGIPVGSLYVALGVLAFYGAIIVVVTSLMLIDRKPHLWKFVHYLSYLIIFDVFIHALYLGTDTSAGLGRTLWVAGNIAVLIAIVLRLKRVGAA